MITHWIRLNSQDIFAVAADLVASEDTKMNETYSFCPRKSSRENKFTENLNNSGVI